jgi:hypothetical protein
MSKFEAFSTLRHWCRHWGLLVRFRNLGLILLCVLFQQVRRFVLSYSNRLTIHRSINGIDVHDEAYGKSDHVKIHQVGRKALPRYPVASKAVIFAAGP